MALGAPRALIFRMVVGRALKLVEIGVVAGALGCVGLRHVLAAALYGVGPNDGRRWSARLPCCSLLHSPRRGSLHGAPPGSMPWPRSERSLPSLPMVIAAGSCSSADFYFRLAP